MEEDSLIKSLDNTVYEAPSSDDESGPLPQRHQVAMESKRMRLLPLLELLLPSATICTLFWIGDWQYTGMFTSFVKRDQATTQMIVQVFSHILAMLQVSSMCAVLNLSTRYRSLHRSISLGEYSLWIALSTARVDLKLPTLHLLVASTFVAATLIPGALWVGALSPIFVPKSQGLAELLLPAFTKNSIENWDSQFELRGPGHQVWNLNNNCTVIKDVRGLVPSCPVPTLQGPLLLSASSATTWNGDPRNHSKLDKPNWEFIGRSFGVGSSVGQSDGHIADDRVLYYNYTESGYLAHVSCIKNSTSDFHFRLINYSDQVIPVSEYPKTHHPELHFNDSFPSIWVTLSTYYVEGYLPNSILETPETYPAIAWHEKYENIAAWATVVNENRNIIAVAAGTNLYQELNQTQCEVFFKPTAFNVAVDRLQQSIIVEAQPLAEAVDIEPTGHLQANVMHSINLLSRMSPSLYVSVLGETLSRNVERMQKQRPHLNQTEVVTSAVADSFIAIIDDILVAYGVSQLSNAQDATSSAVRGVVEAVQIGESRYRYLVLIANFLIIVAVGFEAARTRGWRALTKFNYLDFKSVIIAASAGGGGIAKVVSDEHHRQRTRWVGDPTDPIASAMKVELAHTETIAMVEASDLESMQARELKRTGRGSSIKMGRLDSKSKALYRSKSQ